MALKTRPLPIEAGDETEELQHHQSFMNPHVHLVLAVIICTFGCLCNLLTLIVLTRPAMRRVPANTLLAGLSGAHCFLCVNYLLYTLYDQFLDGSCAENAKSLAWLTTLLINVNISLIAHTIQLAHNCLLAVFRYAAITWPRKFHFTLHKAQQGVVVIYLVTPLVCIPFFFNSTIDSYQLPSSCTTDDRNDTVTYRLEYSKNRFLVTYNYWFFAVICKLTPSLLMGILGPLQIVRLLKIQKRRQQLTSNASTRKTQLPNRKAGFRRTFRRSNYGRDGSTRVSVKDSDPLDEITGLHLGPGGKNSGFSNISSLLNHGAKASSVAKRDGRSNSMSVVEAALTSSVPFFRSIAVMALPFSTDIPVALQPRSFTADQCSAQQRLLPMVSNVTHKQLKPIKTKLKVPLMLAVIVLLCVLIELPQGLLNLAYGLHQLTGRQSKSIGRIYDQFADFFELLTVAYSGVNFVLYCGMSRKFRGVFKQCFFTRWTQLSATRR